MYNSGLQLPGFSYFEHKCIFMTWRFRGYTGGKMRHRKHGELREGIFTWVVEKKNGNWLIIASQNTENMPILSGQ